MVSVTSEDIWDRPPKTIQSHSKTQNAYICPQKRTSCTQIGFKLKSRRLDFLWGQDGIPTLRTPSRYCSGQDLRNTSVQKLLMNQNILTTRAKGQKCRGVGSTSAALSRNFMCWNTNYLSRGATLSPKQCLFVPRGGGEHESRLRSTAIW